MTLTLAQVQERIAVVWAAVNAGELTFTVAGRVTTFHSLESLQRHLDWLMALEQRLINEAAAAAGSPEVSAPVVEFQEPL